MVILMIDCIRLKDKNFELFLKEEDILSGIREVNSQINEYLHYKKPVFICVLNGAFMFASELVRQFQSECEICFIRIKSYQGVERNISQYEIQGLVEDISNRNIVIVEDIIDTGHTMNYLLHSIRKSNPSSIKIATLLFKPNALQVNIRPDYVVKEIPNDFIVGFGLDYEGIGRNLRNIYKIKD